MFLKWIHGGSVKRAAERGFSMYSIFSKIKRAVVVFCVLSVVCFFAFNAGAAFASPLKETGERAGRVAASWFSAAASTGGEFFAGFAKGAAEKLFPGTSLPSWVFVAGGIFVFSLVLSCFASIPVGATVFVLCFAGYLGV